MRLLKVIVALHFFVSFSALANPEVEKLVLEYKKAMNSHNKKRVQELVTEEYYQSLTANDLLDRLFKSGKPQQKEYKVEVVESKVVKGAIMASALEKDADEQGHKDWYEIKKTKTGYLIQREIHLD